MQQRRNSTYEFLYQQIVTYAIKPGMSIVESDIAKALNVSRTPVREALNRLEADGLVNYEERRGFFAAEVSEKDVKDICFLRRILEVAALREGFSYISKEELLHYKKWLGELSGDDLTDEAYAFDCAFHGMIVEKSGNMRLIRFVNTLNATVDRFRRIAGYNMERPKKSREEHLEIINALLDDNLEKACTLLDQHIGNVEGNILRVYRQWFLF